jgi:acyl-[acyl carrier protein]--UDP-N-acetylglucosamine O-acyltransferase
MGVSFTLLTNGMSDIHQEVRIAAFNWLDEQVGIHGDVLPRSILAQGRLNADRSAINRVVQRVGNDEKLIAAEDTIPQALEL